MTLEERQAELRNRFKVAFEESDALEPQIKVRIGRNDYTLEMTNRAVRGILRDTGLNLLEKSIEQKQMEDPNILGVLFYHGLHKHHPDLDQDAVDDLWTVRHKLYIQAQLHAAMDLFLPNTDGIILTEEEKTQLELIKGGKKVEDPLLQPRADGSDTGPQGEDSDFLMTSSGTQP